MSFVHLHVHSEYSLSSSLLRLEKLCARAVEMKCPAVALTDWCNLYGALHFMKAAKYASTPDFKLKPIYGVEMGVLIDGAGTVPRHLVLLAENDVGYKNLSSLVTRSHIEFGFEGGVLSPKLPLDVICKHSEGLIALTAGLKGVLNSFIIQDQESLALETLKKLQAAFGPESLYLELQDANLSLQRRCNEKLIEWSASQSVPVVATADVHYETQDDAFAQEVWMMVAQKLTLEENPTSRLTPREYYLRTPEEMREAFSNIPEACDNTLKIAERCTVKHSFVDDKGKRIFHLPDFARSKEESQDEIFARLACEGLKNRLSKIKTALTPEQDKAYWDRLTFEVKTIQDMGFSGYYLIVSDFIRHAKKNGIPVGPGRGSGAGSLAAYSLDITDLDPIFHGLLFERFLNPERVSLPDFDVDFCQQRRAEVIRYVSEKYGNDRVCQIVTFAKEQSKNALKDVGRVLGMSFGETNRLTKLIPAVMAKPLTIQESLDQVDEFKQLVESDPKVKQCTELALRIEGALRQPGVHAAGVIIASRNVADIAPLSCDQEGHPITQWDMKMSEEAGLVKFDFLGLVTLDLMDLACGLINKRPEPAAQALKYDNIPIDEPKAYELMAKGQTMGVFQLESSGMQNLCVRMKPDRFADITAINALFRPGPLQSGMVDDFINRKHGRQKIEVMFAEMEPILRDTYGVIIYQEQVMEIARQIAGYTLGGADLLRRAMGKKNAKEMDAQRAIFVEGAVKAGKAAAKAAELFDLIEKFAGYGFNKSHAAAYALLAVQTAYLKAIYPTEFITALLTIEKEDTERLSRYIADARSMGIQILPPDVNESDMDFSIVSEGVIRFGLSAVKNVGEGGVEGILEARKKGGPFKDLFDFVSRIESGKVNKRLCEALIQSGAFDSMGESTAQLRGSYLATVEKALEWASSMAAKKAEGQFSLFGDSTAERAESAPRMESPIEAPSSRQLLDWEKELLGIYLTGSPLDKYANRAKAAGALAVFDLREKAPKTVVTVAVVVQEIREVRVKKGRRAGELMGIAKLEDPSGQIEFVSFPDHYKEFSALLKSNQPLLIRAELDFEEDKPKLMAGQVQVGGHLSIEDLAQVEERMPRKVKVGVQLSRIEGIMSHEQLFSEIAKVLKKFQGPVPVELLLQKSGHFQTKMELPSEFSVQPADDLIKALNTMLAIPGSMTVETVL